MTLAKGKILTITTAWLEVFPDVLYTAESDVTITYMQYVSEHDADVDVNIFLNYLDGTIYSIPKDTPSKSVEKTIIQLDTKYSLQAGESITAIVSVDNVINYVIQGDLE